MNRLKKEYPLEGFIDSHIHTAPDIKPRILNDIGAAKSALKEKMRAIVIKSHLEPTSGRAWVAHQSTGFTVLGGVCLNQSIGGINLEAVKTAESLGGKVIWLPTSSYSQINLNNNELFEIMGIIAEKQLILATGHLNVEDIYRVLDMAVSVGVKKILVNHPLTRVVNASIEEQKEMARKAYLEHCYVACMEKHDGLNPKFMARAIGQVGPKRCIMATDFGQIHNPQPVEGMKMFVKEMMNQGISERDIKTMCIKNPLELFFK
jgi:hypothetical protein